MLANILLIAHVISAVFLVLIILMQRSDGGMGAMAGGSSAMFSANEGANPLSRATAILAVVFMGTALTLAVENSGESAAPSLMTQQVEESAPEVPMTLPASEPATTEK